MCEEGLAKLNQTEKKSNAIKTNCQIKQIILLIHECKRVNML